MAELRRRLARLERMAGGLLPDPSRCPCCHGGSALALSDEPENAITPYHPRDRCSVCGTPPQDVKVVAVPAELAELFDGMPWSPSPVHRLLEKMMLLKAMAEGDQREAEYLVRRFYERADASGGRPGAADGGAHG